MVRRMTLALGLVLVSAASVFAGSGSAALQDSRARAVRRGPHLRRLDRPVLRQRRLRPDRQERRPGLEDRRRARSTASRLDGLGVVAVVAANNTLGLEQTGPGQGRPDRRRAGRRRRSAKPWSASPSGRRGKLLANVVARARRRRST